MSVELAILGDTHIPSRSASIPAWVRERVRAADHTVHTGDFDSPETLDRIATLASGDLTAVAGNDDPPEIDLPEVAVLDREDVRFVVTHGNGGSAGYEDRIARVVRQHGGEGAIGVSGHTHEYLDTVFDGRRLLNPGSATGAHPAGEPTMMTATVDGGDVEIELRRGPVE